MNWLYLYITILYSDGAQSEGNPIKLSEQYLVHMSFPTRNEKRFAGSNMLGAIRRVVLIDMSSSF